MTSSQDFRTFSHFPKFISRQIKETNILRSFENRASASLLELL